MRVLLIDDHALFRIGLQELLERRGISVVGVVGESAEGLELAATAAPDVVLLDLRMPEESGLSVLRRLRQAHPALPVAMLTTSTEERDIVESLREGAQGYLLKDMEPDELIEALAEMAAGQTVVAKELAGVLAKAVRGTVESAERVGAFSELTPRELEILCHLAGGHSNKVIARCLGITEGTVKLHVKAILRKLHVHSRVEAAVIAVERNLCIKGHPRGDADGPQRANGGETA